MADPLVGEIGDDGELRFDELCARLGAQALELIELIEHGVARPVAPADEPAAWAFDQPALARVRRALRLQRDLGVNAAGAALALELLDEIERLRAALARGGDGPWWDA
jgi:chaperone modulatory protein CbpM